MIKQNIIPQEDGFSQELTYPAQFHFRIIADAGADIVPALEAVVGASEVTAPLKPSRASSGGHYTAYSVSIIMQSREELEAFDVNVKKIPGVRMLL